MTSQRPLLEINENSNSETDEDEIEVGEFNVLDHRSEASKKFSCYRGVGIMALMTTIVGLLTFLVAKELVNGAGVTDNNSQEKESSHWLKIAGTELKKTLSLSPTLGRAKNVIMFIGDGMGPTTVTAGRILAGQMEGNLGEDHRLSFDHFPYTGLAVTYSVDTQVTDSAASATAFTSGVKTNQGMLGLNAKATRSNCSSSKGNEVDTILDWFLKDGKAAGVVTTATVTHATPASLYAHTPERDWELDTFMSSEAKTSGCKDIALQLVEDNPNINVILGGGMNNFKPLNNKYPRPDQTPWLVNLTKGRVDNQDLTQVWQDKKKKANEKYKFVSSRTDLKSLDVKNIDFLFGLFSEFFMQYEVERDDTYEPSLAEMTEKAIGVLQNNDKGYFLMVEGARIDHGHHSGQPSKALHDVVAFSKAVEKAVNLTKESDTLILVTADHSHTFTIAGYASRGNPILGKSDTANKTTDDKPYTTLLYGNGPGYKNPRPDLSLTNTTDKDYISQSAVPVDYATHGGEDVAMYARGPQSFLYSGVHENNYIPMLMAYAACVGPYKSEGNCAQELVGNASIVIQVPHLALIMFTFLIVEFFRR